MLAMALGEAAHSQTRRALLIGINDYAPSSGAHVSAEPQEHSPDSRFAPGSTWVSLRGPLNDVTSVQILLRQNFGFEDVRVLPQERATRLGILEALDKLIDDTRSGDIDVIYYAGHGSRRLDTLSSKHHFDQTIVPVDAGKGAEDIRDKELAFRFNQIVYDKHAHLTAIFDSCDSGTMARGITRSTVRALPYDDRDVAEEKKRDPKTIVESDLQQLPQNGDAIILAAAGPGEAAQEAEYLDDLHWHGAFTRALVNVLRSSTQPLAAEDVIAAVSAVLHAEGGISFQQPSAEGRIDQSLFGSQVPPHPLRVHVSRVTGTTVTLDLGSAAGFDVGTQFSSTEVPPEAVKAIIEVQHVDGPLESSAKVVAGQQTVKVGETFEVTKMTYPSEARLVVFAARPEADPAGAIVNAKRSFPTVQWTSDPTDRPIDFLVIRGKDGWVAYDQTGRVHTPESSLTGTAFLLQGPIAGVRAALEQSLPFQAGAFAFTQKPEEADYYLATRLNPSTSLVEYALFSPVIMAPHKPDAWVHSIEDKSQNAVSSRSVTPEVVCRNDVSLPVRSAWLPDTPGHENDLVLSLNRRILRLGRLRVWLRAASVAPGTPGWPYHLVVSDPRTGAPFAGLLHPGDAYVVQLTMTAQRRAASAVIPRYVYLLGFDCSANPLSMYPPKEFSGEAPLPQPDAGSSTYPLSIDLVRTHVVRPLGADTIFLLVTAEKLTDPSVLVQEGPLSHGVRAINNRFDELITDIGDDTTRGMVITPSDWLVQQVVVPSRPAN